MIKVYTSLHEQDAILMETYLQSFGIDCEIRNEFLQGLPVTDAPPEVWIVNDSDLEKASELVAEYWDEQEEKASWDCPECGETVEGQFGTCWNCEYEKETE